jgi:hypothetical protein
MANLKVIDIIFSANILVKKSTEQLHDRGLCCDDIGICNRNFG